MAGEHDVLGTRNSAGQNRALAHQRPDRDERRVRSDVAERVHPQQRALEAAHAPGDAAAAGCSTGG